jgi:hypothetical protein
MTLYSLERLNEPQSRSVNEIKMGVDRTSFSSLQIHLREKLINCVRISKYERNYIFKNATVRSVIGGVLLVKKSSACRENIQVVSKVTDCQQVSITPCHQIGQVAFNVTVANCTALLVAKRHFSVKGLSKQSDSNFRNVTLLSVKC